MSDDTPAVALTRVASAAVSALQRNRDSSSRAAGQLAALRRSHALAPGAHPALWDLTVAPIGADAALNASERVRTAAEHALHVTLCLYASHQQSRPEDMHRPGVGVGRAVGRLERQRPGAGDGPSPVRRRFDAAVTADTTDETAYHLRGLVAQMRTDGIPLDYGRLAADLYLLSVPSSADAVRRRWGRDLYAHDTDTTTEGAS